MQIVRFDRLESTNKYCEVLDLAKVEDFTCYWALEQTAGTGQRGNRWESTAGENLTFSIILKPKEFPANRQFLLTQAVSLAVVDFLESLGLDAEVHIKWPNDIYIGTKKVCGILTSAKVSGTYITSAVCGIGLNVNQTVFPKWIPNPVSLSMVTGKRYELETLLGQLTECIEKRYRQTDINTDLDGEYLGRLLGYWQSAKYRYEGKVIDAVIRGVDQHGRLLLTASDGRELCCAMKEIEKILD